VNLFAWDWQSTFASLLFLLVGHDYPPHTLRTFLNHYLVTSINDVMSFFPRVCFGLILGILGGPFIPCKNVLEYRKQSQNSCVIQEIIFDGSGAPEAGEVQTGNFPVWFWGMIWNIAGRIGRFEERES
jgi:hypothetical protein